RAEIPPGLQRPATVRTAASQALAALRARVEVDADGRTTPATQRAHLAHLGDHAQQLLGSGDAALHLRQPVFAERDHAAGDRRLADLIFGRLRRDEPAQLVGDAHHLVDADAAAVAGVIALIATDRF